MHVKCYTLFFHCLRWRLGLFNIAWHLSALNISVFFLNLFCFWLNLSGKFGWILNSSEMTTIGHMCPRSQLLWMESAGCSSMKMSQSSLRAFSPISVSHCATAKFIAPRNECTFLSMFLVLVYPVGYLIGCKYLEVDWFYIGFVISVPLPQI